MNKFDIIAIVSLCILILAILVVNYWNCPETEHFTNTNKIWASPLTFPAQPVQSAKLLDQPVKINQTNQTNQEPINYGNYICYPKPKVQPKQLVTEQTNKIFASDTMDIDDPSVYYSKLFKAVPVGFGDDLYRGYNNYSEPEFSNLKDIGYINLNKTVEYPRGVSE